MSMANVEETRYESLSSLPSSDQKKETSSENRLVAPTALAVHDGDDEDDGRIGLGETMEANGQEHSYHHHHHYPAADIEQEATAVAPTKLAEDLEEDGDAESNCTRMMSPTKTDILDKHLRNMDADGRRDDFHSTTTTTQQAPGDFKDAAVSSPSSSGEHLVSRVSLIKKPDGSMGRNEEEEDTSAMENEFAPIPTSTNGANGRDSSADNDGSEHSSTPSSSSIKASSSTRSVHSERPLAYYPSSTINASAAAAAAGFAAGATGPIYPYGPYFANPFMPPFVAAHLPQAQANDYGELPVPQHQHPESFAAAAAAAAAGRAGRVAAYNNAEFVAQAKYYRELLEQYLRSMGDESADSGMGESTLSSMVNLRFDPETGMAKMMPSGERIANTDCNANRFANSTLTKDSRSSSPNVQGVELQKEQQSRNVSQCAAMEGETGKPSEALSKDSAGQQDETSHSDVQEARKEESLPTTENTSDDQTLGSSGKLTSETADTSTTALIRKQITEIEKQIMRNAQNQNTRKMDPKEVEAFLSEQKFAASCGADALTSEIARSQVDEQDPSAAALNQAHYHHQTGQRFDSMIPTMPNTIGSHPPGYADPYYGVHGAGAMIPGGYPPSVVPWQSNYYYPAADSYGYNGQFIGRLPYPMMAGGGQMPVYGAGPTALGQFPYSYAMPQNHAFTSPVAAAAAVSPVPAEKVEVRQEHESTTAAMNRSSAQRTEANCVAAVEMSAPSSSSSSSALSSLDGTPLKSVENFRKFTLPCDSASIDSIGSFRETNDDEDVRWVSQDRRSSGNHADDEEEPVWVLRESYVRKLKREEERKAQKERCDVKRQQQSHLETADKALADSDDNETDKLLGIQQRPFDQTGTSGGVVGVSTAAESQKLAQKKVKKKKEVIIHEPAVLIEGVLFRARYLGSTQLACDGRPSKSTRMMQAQEAVGRIKASDGENQPFTDVDLFISTEKIMVLNSDLQDSIMMDHPLRTISYIADIGELVVLMARRVSQSSPDSPDSIGRRTPKIMCHVFESDEAQFIAQSIGQAFQVAYMEFLRANGIEDANCMRDVDYQEVLNAQEMFGEELELFASKETERDVVVPKQKNEILGVVIVESGWGSMLPTVVIANMMSAGPAARSNQLNIGDHIITINGISLVGLPLSDCQNHVRSVRHLTAVKLTVVRTAPVVEVRMRRPDTKYQLGFSVQNGVICSLLRGGIGERGGVRVGHRIIEINSQSVVAVPHDTIVTILASAIGEIHMKTMPTAMYRLLTGQETPNYL